MSSDFKDAFEDVVGNLAGGLGAAKSESYIAEVQAAIDRSMEILESVANRYHDNPLHSLKGFLAEAHHAASFNIDAARKQVDVSAILVGSTERGSADVLVSSPRTHNIHEFQLKFYKTPEATAKELSDPAYHHMGKVGPAEQLDDIRQFAASRAQHIGFHRPEQAKELQDTASRVTDRISIDGAESRPLTSDEALQMAREVKHGNPQWGAHGYSLESAIDVGDIARQSEVAAVSSAAVSAAIRAAPYVYHSLRSLVLRGKISGEELKAALVEGGKGAAQGAIRGALAAAVVGACKTGALGEGAKSLDPSGVGATVAVLLSSISDAIRVKQGKMTASEFSRRTGRRVVVGTGAVVGAHVGQAVIPVPVLGAVVGNIVGSIIGTVGYEGGKLVIERLENREAWEAQIELAQAIVRLAMATHVTAEQMTSLVRLQAAEMRALTEAATRWASQSADFQTRHQAITAMREGLNARFARQRERIEKIKSNK